MKKKTVLSVAASTLVTTLAVVGVTYAATPAGNDTSLLNKGTVEVDSIKVGKQGTGGVTFFNGSIVNSTTTNGVGNPITIADDARIDGRVWRGDNAGGGLGDNKPFIINDDTQVAGSLTVGGTDIFAEIATKANSSDLAAKANSSDVYTKTQVDSSLAGKSDTSHLHDDRYYTESEVDSALSGKSDTSHNHDTQYVELGQTNRQMIIPGNSFFPRAEDVDYVRDLASGGSIRLDGAETNEGFTAPINLPVGSQITWWRIRFLDNQVADDITVDLISHDLGADTSTTERTLTSSGSAGTFAMEQPLLFLPLTLDADKAYSLRVNFPVADGLFKLVNVELVYTTPTTNP